MAEGVADMRFAHSRSSDHEVGRFFQPLRIKELQEFFFCNFRVEDPVKVV